MFDKLLPKEEKYFEYFNEMIAHISQMADMSHALFASVPYDKTLMLEMIPVERRCDDILRKVLKQLNKTFITPFDREDIFALIKRMDDISDIILSASVRTDIFRLETSVEGAEEITRIVVKQVQELQKAIHDLKERTNGMDELKAVKDLESEADSVYRAAMKSLFDSEKDPIELIKKKEILDLLENASDKCQSVANVIIAIFIKNS